jgi:hypothetical protein
VIVTEPGVYDGMPDATYHGDPVPGGSLSSTGARRLLPPSCPALFKYEQDHPRQPTEAMEFGTAAHKAILGAGTEPVIVEAENWRTKAAKEAAAEARAAGRVPLLPADYERVKVLAAAVRAHPLAAILLDPAYGKPEQSLFWVDPSGIWCRARLDWLRIVPNRRSIIVDVKTIKSADARTIAKSVADLGYHQQDEFYRDGVRALRPGDDPAFMFIFVESSPPHLVTVAQLDEDALAVGRARNRQAIERYRDCAESGIWPGYDPDPDHIETISLPAWAARAEEYA